MFTTDAVIPASRQLERTTVSTNDDSHAPLMVRRHEYESFLTDQPSDESSSTILLSSSVELASSSFLDGAASLMLERHEMKSPWQLQEENREPEEHGLTCALCSYCNCFPVVQDPILKFCEHENPIEDKANPGNIITGSPPMMRSTVISHFDSSERMYGSLPLSSKHVLNANTNQSNIQQQHLQQPVLISFSSSSAFCDSHLSKRSSSMFLLHTANSKEQNPVSATFAVANGTKNGTAVLSKHGPHETMVTELLQDFFFGGKLIPSPENHNITYSIGRHITDNNTTASSNPDTSCCDTSETKSKDNKAGFLAPASPTTVMETCLGEGGAEQLALVNPNTGSYGAMAQPPSQLSKQPPAPQQIQRRTIFKRNSLPFYPNDAHAGYQPRSPLERQRSSSLSSLPTSVTTKINNMHHSHYTQALCHGKMPAKPALKRSASLGKVQRAQQQQKQAPPQQRHSRGRRGRVSFSTLEFREYDIALSDHPGCSYGPPIQLGWDYGDEATVVALEDYEKFRTPRRSGHQLVLSVYDRRFSLQTAGYSKADLQRAVQEVERVKRQRSSTKSIDKLLLIGRELAQNCCQWIQGIFCGAQHQLNGRSS
jgi:hypothetical protein